MNKESFNKMYPEVAAKIPNPTVRFLYNYEDYLVSSPSELDAGIQCLAETTHVNMAVRLLWETHPESRQDYEQDFIKAVLETETLVELARRLSVCDTRAAFICRNVVRDFYLPRNRFGRGLSVRAFNAVHRSGAASDEELAEIYNRGAWGRGVGISTVKEIRDYLVARGYNVKE